MMFFDEEKFWFKIYQSIPFGLYSYCLEVFPFPETIRYSLIFSSKSFVVLLFTFRSIMHLELIFCLVPGRGPIFYVFLCRYPIVLVSFIVFFKNLFFLLLSVHYPFFRMLSVHRCLALSLDSLLRSIDLFLYSGSCSTVISSVDLY